MGVHPRRKLRPKLPQSLPKSALVGADELVPGCIRSFIHLLAPRIRIEPLDRSPNPLRKRNFGTVAGNKALDLAVIEDHAHSLIPSQAAHLIWHGSAQEIRRNVNDLRLNTRGLRGDPIVLIPSHHFFAGDMKGMANGLPIPQQAHQSLGKIAVVAPAPFSTGAGSLINLTA